MHNLTEASVSIASKAKTEESITTKSIKRQLTLSAIKITGALEESYGTDLMIYLAEGGLPHTHMELKELERLIQTLQPGYKPKLAQTAKRHLLKLYALMKIALQDFLT